MACLRRRRRFIVSIAERTISTLAASLVALARRLAGRIWVDGTEFRATREAIPV